MGVPPKATVNEGTWRSISGNLLVPGNVDPLRSVPFTVGGLDKILWNNE